MIMLSVFNVEEEEYGTDVSGYLGLTVREALRISRTFTMRMTDRALDVIS